MKAGSCHRPIAVVAAAGTLGFSSIITQLVLMRELLSVYHGNELVLGIVLGNWLLGSGLGAWLGRSWRRQPGETEPASHAVGFLAGMVCLAWLPVATVMGLRFLRNVVFVRGAMVGVTATFWSSLLFLLPYCLLSGLLLTMACGLGAGAAGSKEGAIRRVYIADGLGSLAGGLLFTFVFVHAFDPLELLTLTGLMVGGVSFAISLEARHRIPAWGSLGSLLLLGGFGMWGQGEERSAQWQFPGQRIVLSEHSPYGRILVTEAEGQLNVIENGVVVGSSRNLEHAEETAHYAMIQRPQARRVLLVSGTLSGVLTEILKYPVDRVMSIEPDAGLIRVAQEYLGVPATHSRVDWVIADARQGIRQMTDRFDVVILDLPDPSTIVVNRYYTAEFYRELKRVMNPGGVVAFSLGHYENYVSRDLAILLSSADQTLRQAFGHILVLPGLRVFFLASDQPLQADIAGLLAKRGIDTRLVNANYLRGMHTPDRLADIQRAVTQPARINRDFSPTLYFHEVRRWVSLFSVRLGPWETGLLLVILAALAGMGRQWPSLAVFMSGFTGSAMQVTLLLAFQIVSGALYVGLGFLVAVFMAGLVAGAWITRGHRPGTDTGSGMIDRGLGRTPIHADQAILRGRLGWTTLALALLCALLPAVLPGLSQSAGSRVGWLLASGGIPGLVFILATLVGMQFPLASQAWGVTATTVAAASRLYAADFLGAFLGAIVVSSWMLPLLGLGRTCWLTAGLNVMVGGFLFWGKRR
jgi:spermidine synthase